MDGQIGKPSHGIRPCSPQGGLSGGTISVLWILSNMPLTNLPDSKSPYFLASYTASLMVTLGGMSSAYNNSYVPRRRILRSITAMRFNCQLVAYWDILASMASR